MKSGIAVTGIDPTFDYLVSLMSPSNVKLVSGQPYADFDALKADYESTGYIKVSVDYSDNSIFGESKTNWQFRAWHDTCHIKVNADFSPRGEKDAAFEMMRQVINLTGPSWDDKYRWIRLIDEEVNGQTEYYQKHNAFPADQRQFAVDYLVSKFGPEYVASFPRSLDSVQIAA